MKDAPLLTETDRRFLPRLGTLRQDRNPVVQLRLFTPDADITWFPLEFDGVDKFFGWVYVGKPRMVPAHFSLKQLTEMRGPCGEPVCRDEFFCPKPLRVAKMYLLSHYWPHPKMRWYGAPIKPQLLEG